VFQPVAVPGSARGGGEGPEDLVAAQVEHLNRLLSFLNKPRGAALERFGFTFRHVGQHGREAAWRIKAREQ